jgi:hypothetical protein
MSRDVELLVHTRYSVRGGWLINLFIVSRALIGSETKVN